MKCLLVVLLIPLNVNSALNYCDIVQDATTIREFPVTDDVNYFIRGAPETNEIGFPTSKANILLNLNTGQKVEVPGQIDPILTPDGKILGIPQIMLFDPKTKTFSPLPIDFSGMQIIQGRVQTCTQTPCREIDRKVDDILRSGQPYSIQVMTFYTRDSLEKPIYIDKDANFNYQSFGKLRKSDSVTAYRMLFETQDGIRARDYEYDERTKTFSSIGPVKPLCDGLRGALPSQNKTGDEYSAYDAEKGVTHVFSIGKSGTECKITETLPGMVGKIDFSPDGKKLAYHVDRKMDSNQTRNIIKYPKDNNDIKSLIYDRLSKKPAIVADSVDKNSYYPIFLSNDTIAYIASTKTDHWIEKPQFKVTVAKLQNISTPNCPRCFENGSSEEQVAAFIGAIRERNCENDPHFYFKNGIPSFSNLRVAQCRSVVESCDSKCLAEVKSEIAKISSSGGPTIGDIAIKTVQKWNLERVSTLKKEDLSKFCSDFENANRPSSGGKVYEKGAR